jgi:tetratricopeptide (TPR) repeat protein
MIITDDPVEIAKANRLKKIAEEAFLNQDFAKAISSYHILIDSLQLEDEKLTLNLAHSYLKLNDTASARNYYSEVSMSSNPQLKSIAYQQLGVMAKSPQTLNESLQYLKASLKANPQNEEARYDYEVAKKLIEQQKQQKNQDQENQ